MKFLVALVGTRFRGPRWRRCWRHYQTASRLCWSASPATNTITTRFQVWACGHHIGYVKGSQNRALAMAMDRAALALHGGAGRPSYAKAAKLAIDGGK